MHLPNCSTPASYQPVSDTPNPARTSLVPFNWGHSKETRRLYSVIDKRLGEVEFVGDEISIADLAILGWAWRHERHSPDQ